MNNFIKEFKSPSASHRTCPYWVWNGEVTKERITKALEQYASLGVGGVLIHPRVGLVTEYLSDEWFDLWAFALAESKRLGLQCNMYDENNFPPPMAGGQTYRDSGIPYRWIELSDDGEVVEKTASKSAWYGGECAPDSMHPDVMKAFLANTYEKYAKRFSDDFGKAIRFSYGDEIGVRANRTSRTGLAWSPWQREAMKRNIGYDLYDKREDLFIDSDTSRATRFDYYQQLQVLMEENYLKPLCNWCGERDWSFTGHFWEHHWPEPFDTPNSMAFYQWMQIPGIDVLGFQFDPDEPEGDVNPLILLTIKEVVSVANQMGYETKSSETFGGPGYETTILRLKRIADWVLVHGINLIVEHMSLMSLSGVRKYDWPHTLSDHSAWWPEYKPLAEHIARMTVAGSTGKQIARCLVLHPTTTGWIIANPLDKEPLMRLRKSQSSLVGWLANHQVDFDLGDEFVMKNHAAVKDDKLVIGEMSYDVVVVPAGMDNFCESTLELLQDYISAGGSVITLGALPAYVDGRKTPAPAKLASQCKPADSLKAMQMILDKLLPRHIQAVDGQEFPAGIAHQVRELTDGSRIHLIANTGPQEVKTTVRITGENLCELDTSTGVESKVESKKQGDDILTLLHLLPGQHAVWMTSPEKLALAVSPAPVLLDGQKIEISEFDRIERTADNVLMLDFCDLAVNGKTFVGQYVVNANNICWQEHGFEADVWRNIQYKREYVDRTFAGDTGFETKYYFEIDTDDYKSIRQAGSVRLAIERHELYSIEVNGKSVSFDSAKRWFDDAIAAADVSDCISPGQNTICLRAKPFNIHCEIDRVYLLGNFSLIPVSPGFKIVRDKPIQNSNCSINGMPFYNATVKYYSTFTLTESAEAIKIAATSSAGAVTVRIDDGESQLVDLWPAGRILNIPLQAGEHDLTAEVFTTPRNLIGPHFWKPDVPFGMRITHSSTWIRNIGDKPADGIEYELVPLKLTGPVSITPIKRVL